MHSKCEFLWDGGGMGGGGMGGLFLGPPYEPPYLNQYQYSSTLNNYYYYIYMS